MLGYGTNIVVLDTAPTYGLFNNQSYYSTLPTVLVFRSESDYTPGNEPRSADIRKFAKLADTVLARRRRVSKEQKLLATSRLRRFGLPPMAESLFDKPTFVRRACGSRWRVMTP